MRIEHDPEADAVYIYLRDADYNFGEDLDPQRRVDFGHDRKPIGVELLGVSGGVDVRDLPDSDAITELLASQNIKVLA